MRLNQAVPFCHDAAPDVDQRPVQRVRHGPDQALCHADGQYRLASEEIHAAVTLNASDLEQSLAPLGIKDVKGKIEAKSDISGPIRKPVFNVNLKGNSLQFQDIAIGDADIAAAMDTAGNLKVSKLAIQNQHKNT